MAIATSKLQALKRMSRTQILATALLTVTVGIFVVYVTNAATVIRGDVDKSGKVDVVDLSSGQSLRVGPAQFP